MDVDSKKKYLATFVQDASIDFQKAALSGWKNPVNPQFATKPHPGAMKHLFPFKENTVEEHDKRYHGGHYQGGACSWRTEHGMKTWKEGEDPNAKADGDIGKSTEQKTDVKTAEVNAAAPASEHGDDGWENYITEESIRKDLGDLGDYLKSAEIDKAIENWRGDDTPDEAAKSVSEYLYDLASQRYDAAMQHKYGQKYDRFGSENW